MLKELKSPQKGSSAWSRVSDSLQVAEDCTVLYCTVLYCTVLQVAEDCLAAVRRLRRELVHCMRQLMREAREGRTGGMAATVEEMMKKTKLICGLSDLATVEEALAFLEENRVTVRPEKESR